jgi:hypothetical protein
MNQPPTALVGLEGVSDPATSFAGDHENAVDFWLKGSYN